MITWTLVIFLVVNGGDVSPVTSTVIDGFSTEQACNAKNKIAITSTNTQYGRSVGKQSFCVSKDV